MVEKKDLIASLPIKPEIKLIQNKNLIDTWPSSSPPQCLPRAASMVSSCVYSISSPIVRRSIVLPPSGDKKSIFGEEHSNDDFAFRCAAYSF